MGSSLESADLILQTISTLFALFGIIVALIGINCENSVAATVYRKMMSDGRKSALKNTTMDVENPRITSHQESFSHVARTPSSLSGSTTTFGFNRKSSLSNTPSCHVSAALRLQPMQASQTIRLQTIKPVHHKADGPPGHSSYSPSTKGHSGKPSNTSKIVPKLRYRRLSSGVLLPSYSRQREADRAKVGKGNGSQHDDM